MLGEGVAFHVPAAKMKKVRVNLTPRQSLVLRKGGAVTIKAITDNGTHEIMLPDVDVKKLMTKLQKGVGGRIKLNGGSVESMFRDAAAWAAPVANAAQDRAIREIGRGLFDEMTPVVDKIRFRPAVMPNKSNLKYFTKEELDRYGYKGSGVKKRGRPRKGLGVLDFLDPKKNGAERFFTKTLPDTLIDEGIPIAVGAVGSTVGAATGNPLLGMAGSMAGKELGKEAARRIRRKQGRGVLTDLAMEVAKKVAKQAAKKVNSYGAKKARQGATSLIDRAEKFGNEMVGEGIMPAGVGKGILPAGVNLRRGAGLGMNDAPIQTGVPYLQKGAPGWTPYVPSQNPFATNTMVGRAPKHGGKVIRM
jgi:hypothetical protein